jgi:hypothetical protein
MIDFITEFQNNMLGDLTMAEYLAYGATKEEKADAIVLEMGFVVLPPEDLMP